MRPEKVYLLFVMALTVVIFSILCAFNYAYNSQPAYGRGGVDIYGGVGRLSSMPLTLSISLGMSGGGGSVSHDDSDTDYDEWSNPAEDREILLQIRDMFAAMLGIITVVIAFWISWKFILYPLRMCFRW